MRGYRGAIHSRKGQAGHSAFLELSGGNSDCICLAPQCNLLCHLYRIQHHHELMPSDFVKQRSFAVWVFQKMEEDDNWLSNVLWTDKAHFTLRGSDNSQNYRIQATENPRTLVQTPLLNEKVTVWCGFTASTIIKPFFFKKMHDSGFETVSVTGERFAYMLESHHPQSG